MLTGRGRGTIALAAVLYLAAWGFGTAALFPIAIGLLAAPLIAWLWIGFLQRPMTLRRTTGQRELVEGGRVAVDLEVRADGGPLPGRAVVIDRVGSLGPREVVMVRAGRALRGRWLLEAAPRGRYQIGGAVLVLDDPFGLVEAQVALERRDTLLVYPRVFMLDGFFTDAGSAGGDEGRALLHRTAGYDLHSIRDFQQGESLRRVHWRSTAKRRKLMVKELTETPRDEACVLLDGDRSCVAGARGSSSFDAQVRATASLLARMVALGQRCALVVHGAVAQRTRIHAGGGEWSGVLASLAAVEPDAERPLHAMLREVLGGGADSVDAARVFVVTGALTPLLADRLIALRSSRRQVALVWVDTPTFAGARPHPGADEAAALRLARAGIAVARIRSDSDIGATLSAAATRMASHA